MFSYNNPDEVKLTTTRTRTTTRRFFSGLLPKEFFPKKINGITKQRKNNYILKKYIHKSLS